MRYMLENRKFAFDIKCILSENNEEKRQFESVSRDKLVFQTLYPKIA